MPMQPFELIIFEQVAAFANAHLSRISLDTLLDTALIEHHLHVMSGATQDQLNVR